MIYIRSLIGYFLKFLTMLQMVVKHRNVVCDECQKEFEILESEYEFLKWRRLAIFCPNCEIELVILRQIFEGQKWMH